MLFYCIFLCKPWPNSFLHFSKILLCGFFSTLSVHPGTASALPHVIFRLGLELKVWLVNEK